MRIMFLLGLVGCSAEHAATTHDAGGESETDGGAGGSVDAGFDAGPDARIGGTVRFENRAISPDGLAPGVLVAAAAMPVELLSGSGASLGHAVTDETGAFEFPFDPSAAEVRITARYHGAGGRLEVTDQSDAIYGWRHSVTLGAANEILIAESDGSGAIAMMASLTGGMEFAADAHGLSEKPAVAVRWERGRNTPLGSSYMLAGLRVLELWILGTPEDSDEFDVPVLLHELGHAIQETYDWTRNVPGNPHAKNDTDPRNAWSEGSATFFGQLVLNSSVYIDSFDGGADAWSIDLDALDESVHARSDRGIDQRLHEHLIAMIAWKLYRENDDTITQRDRAYQVMRDWIGTGHDRGAFGPDLVDYLDGYLCTHGDASRSTIRSSLVEERGFPYDFGASCKPGRSPASVSLAEICAGGSVACSWSLGPNGIGRLSPEVSITRDRLGRRVHLVDLDPAARPSAPPLGAE
jgi:hypothetical protein